MKTITCEKIVREHLEHLSEGFSCSTIEDRIWIVSPFAYPDSDLLELTVDELRSGEMRVSDLGETLRHLATLGFNPRSTSKGEYLLSEITKQHHVEIDRGMIIKKVPPQALGEAIHDVLMASLATAHLLALSRGSGPATFAEEVAHVLADLGVKFEPRYKAEGKSGTIYEFDFLVHGPEKEGLLVALSPATLNTARTMVNSTFRKWSDVNNGRWHGTILDDRYITWRPTDVSLLGLVSELVRWTDQVALRKTLEGK